MNQLEYEEFRRVERRLANLKKRGLIHNYRFLELGRDVKLGERRGYPTWVVIYFKEGERNWMWPVSKTLKRLREMGF